MKISSNKKILYWSLAGIFFAVSCIAIGWFLGHQAVAIYDPYQDLEAYKSSRHVYLVKSAEISVKMANKAIEAQG